jgi:hypothetical protein
MRHVLCTLSPAIRLSGLVLAAAVVLLSASPARAQNAASGLDELVLAQVNQDRITRAALITRLVDYRGGEALEKLINRSLVLQAIKQANLTVTEDEVAKRLKDLQEKFKGDAEYREFLKRSRLKEDQLKEEMRFTILVQKVALKATPITEADLEQYDARILVAPDKAAAEKWIKDLMAGGNFRQMAAERNADPNLKQAAGRLKPFLKIEMLDIAQAIEEQKLIPQTYTKVPVKLAEDRWAIIQLENRIRVVLTSGSERERLEAAVTAYRVDQWLDQAREKAKIERKPLSEAVVATVNGEPINRGALVTRLLEFQGEETLELMVNRTLLIGAAKKLGVTVTDAEAEKLYADFRAKFKTQQEWEAFIGRAGVSEKQLKDELRYNTLMERLVLKESPIVEDDLQRYSVRMLIAPDRAAAERWIKELENGADFLLMVLERSADEEGRQSGGQVKPFMRVELLDVWRAIDEQKLKPGGYTKTPVLLTDNSWAIIKLENKLAPPAEKDPERERLRGIVTNYRVGQWLSQTRAAAQIAYPVPLSGAVIRAGA